MAKAKKPKRKYNPNKTVKSNPFLLPLPLSREELIKLKMPAHQSMQSLKEGKGTKTDLWNIAFRIRCGFEISKLVYSSDTINEFAEVNSIADRLVLRAYQEGVEGWFPTPDEMQALSDGINVVDEINDTINRAVQLKAYKEAQRIQTELLENVEPENCLA